MDRPEILSSTVIGAFNELHEHAHNVLKQKGYGSFSSTHEIAGVITEEYEELRAELRNRKHGSVNKLKHELKDLAFACLFALACVEQNELDW